MSRKSVTSTEEGMNPLEIGRKRYQEKDYAGAVKAFTDAVNICSDHILLNVLDGRAASYEKLNKLQLALSDARKMIELKPNVSKGYLRCGKVLQLRKDRELALKIYERGLTKVKIGADQERTMLQAIYNKLRKDLNPGKSLDPLEYLPLELAQMICHNLGMRDRVVCLAVSKGWKKLLESSHSLWTVFDTTKARKAINNSSFRVYLKRSNYTLEEAIITMKASINVEKMKFLTKNCKRLRIIQIKGTGSIGESLYDALPDAKVLETLSISRETDISLSNAQKVLKICEETLVDVSFLNVTASVVGYIAGRWPRMELLQSIHLQATIDSCLDFHGLRDSTPNARKVILNDWRIMPMTTDATPWKFLEYLDLRNTQLRHFPLLPPTLRHLLVSDNHHLHVSHTEEDQEPVYNLPLLETFACEMTSIDAKSLKAITIEAAEKGNLKTLLIGGRLTDWLNIPIPNEYPPSETVETLSLSGLQLTDNRAMEIVRLYPKLRKLDLSQTQVSGVTVRDVVEKGVTSLKINECDNVSSDAAEWARGRGVDVQFKFLKKGVSSRRFVDAPFRGFP